jgi:hypothetical protein
VLLQDECEKTGDVKDDNANFNDDDDDDDDDNGGGGGGDDSEEPKDELKIEINEEPECLHIDIDLKHDENDS